MASGGATSFRLLKDKIKHSSIGETVTGKINSIMKQEPLSESPSPSLDTLHHYTSSHHRSASTSSTSSDKVSVKDLVSSNSFSDNDKPTAAVVDEVVDAAREPQQSNIFEQQLLQLQEQLVSSMIENQNLSAELQTIKTDKQVQKLEKDLALERKCNNELLSKISGIAQQSTRMQRDAEPVAADAPDTPSEESTDTSNAEGSERYSMLDTLFHSVLQKYYEIVEDFSVTSDDMVVTEVLEPLSVKKLKLNVMRFGSGISPIFDTMSSFYLLFNWHSPLLTGTVFFVYMYASWTGFLLPSLLFMLVLRLFLNLLEEWKVIPVINLLPMVVRPVTEKERETSVSDKFNIVLDVATKVQNQLGHMADGLEKMRNLFTWKRPEDTKQIFIPVCLLFVLAIFLHMDTIFFVLGSLVGLKLFIVNPVYDRFPRIKQKYDGTSKLYANLITDAELEKQNLRNANNQLVLPRNQPSRVVSESSPQSSVISDLSNMSDTSAMSEEDKAFCERFHLPDEERPVPHPAFKGGRHCIYLEKNSPLKLSTAYNKHTKLYLTPSFLCYELVRQDERKAIPLANIVRVEKKKPLSILPGNGMSLEIVEEGFERPHLFGGLLHRDDCYNTLLEIGRLNDLQYAQSHEPVKKEIRLSELADLDNDIVPEPVDSTVLGPIDSNMFVS